MYLRIDSTNGVPLYLQIAKEVKHSIAIGSLKPGEQLPSVREIALQITVNPNTVAKAYRELEARAILETKRGTGTFVSKKTISVTRQERRKIVRELFDRALDEARHLQMSEDEISRLFVERTAAFVKEKENRELKDE